MVTKIITICFYFLFFLTPLVFTPYNNELFEFNKMFVVYLLTIIISTVWLMEMISSKQLLIKRTPLDIPLMLFLVSQILSTIFSIDLHTSIWGYYSRSNGGLLSTLSYIILYYAFVSYFDGQQTLKFIKAALLGGLVVSLYAIPEHFGVSPSCIILTNSFSVDCWVQDVQARVFATLGQPNWLAAYLAMLIFPTIYFFLTAKTPRERIIHYLSLTTLYLAFTFTYARGAVLGLLAGLAVFTVTQILSFQSFQPRVVKLKLPSHTQQLGIILITFVVINLLYGSALTRFRLITQAPSHPKPTAAVTQLETGGTESGQIRLIVWQGALEIFKAYPLFGSGVETFAYSYYNFRPQEHNLVSEWDFLYNKAHNEYLNYLATTGIVGLGTYLAVIFTFIGWSTKYYVLSIKKKQHNAYHLLLIPSLLAGYTSYLIQNIFGFSVVMIALLFFLFPAIAFVSASDVRWAISSSSWRFIKQLINQTLYRRPIYQKIAQLTLIILALSLLLNLTRLWIADSLFKKGGDFASVGNAGQAYNYLTLAVNLNGAESTFRADLAFAAASAALALAQEDASTSARLIKEADEQAQTSTNLSPRNVSVVREAVRTYYQLSLVDPKYEQTALEMIDRAILLAPTDAKLYYNKALLVLQNGRTQEAINQLVFATQLKPNYLEAHSSLATVYEQEGLTEAAIKGWETILKLVPNDPEAKKKLEELKK